MNLKINHADKLLIISYPFPPIPYSGTFRMMRLCKGLTKLGMTVHVLTIRIDDGIPNDYELLSQVPESVQIHRTHIIDPWRRYQNWKNGHKKAKGFKYINKILSFLFRLITIPDHQIFWIPFAVSRSYKILKKYHIKTVLVSSPPNSSLLIGYFLKRLANVKFIADLRDPIVGNIAQVNLINPTDLISKVEKNVLIFLEKLIVKSADIVITNTETHRKEMKTKYGLNKFYTIRNSFDEDDYKGISQEKYAKFTISHIGSMYGLRKADVLFEAIKRLESELSPDPLNLQVLFVGATDGKLEQAILQYGIEKYVEVIPAVPHSKAIEMMLRSHLLLMVKATGKGSLGQIPAKFYEYLGARNPILCLGPEKSEVAELINGVGVGCVSENNEDKIFEYLEYLYEEDLNNEPLTIDNKAIYNFSADRMARRMKQLI